jgi:RnfABCDGE-type electron transport complex B subunit
MPLTLILAGATMLALAVVMALVLGWANKAFHVEVDPRVEQVNEALPGANCGGCGYVGCNEYAEAVVEGEGKVPVTLCPVGGSDCAQAIAEILGVEVDESAPYRPVVHCGAAWDDRLGHSEYRGEQTCAAANLVGGIQGCAYGCLAFGDCVRSCNYDAIRVIDGVARVNYDNCIGCGACERACPRHIITMVPFKQERMLAIKCSNKDFGKDVKKVCKVGCIGCKICMKLGGDMFGFKDNLPQINYADYSEKLLEDAEPALQKCPMKGLVFLGKPSEADLAATADQESPKMAQPDFQTTVDNTEWWG